MPTERQILGAKIRAAEEEWHLKTRKPYGSKKNPSGWIIPPREERDLYLAEMFGLDPQDISPFFTYSRSCTHPWSAGACDKCP